MNSKTAGNGVKSTFGLYGGAQQQAVPEENPELQRHNDAR
jgi:hypothetical protein